MSFHFGSSDYAKAFQNLPTPDVPALKESALKYLDNFNEQSWYDDPVRTYVSVVVVVVVVFSDEYKILSFLVPGTLDFF